MADRRRNGGEAGHGAPPGRRRRGARTRSAAQASADTPAPGAAPPAAPSRVIDFARRLGLFGTSPIEASPLTGGVSSDIWHLHSDDGDCVIKGALARLRVAQDWHAPVERNLYEARWFEVAAGIEPRVVPRVLGHDPQAMLLAMEYLPPSRYRVWKAELLAGRVDPAVAASLGASLGRLHAGSAHHPTDAARFDNAELFEALRLAPYLRATGRVHGAWRSRLEALADRTAGIRLALIHGDVSPKNVLVGPAGPLLLDAEAATWGDPAFDLAFCLNHLLIKAIHRRESSGDLLHAASMLVAAYAAQVAWEPVPDVVSRAADLVAGLMLARVDGKSPVEYLTSDGRRRVRACAMALLAHLPRDLDEVLAIVRAAAVS